MATSKECILKMLYTKEIEMEVLQEKVKELQAEIDDLRKEFSELLEAEKFAGSALAALKAIIAKNISETKPEAKVNQPAPEMEMAT